MKMESQKIVDVLNDSDIESSKFATKNGTLLIIRIMDNMVKEIKMIQLLNLKQKSLNQIFVITLMHIFS